MIAGTVFNNLVSTLEDAPRLKYVKNFYKGDRFKVEPDSMPCIMFEPTINNDVAQDMNQVKKIWLSVNVTAFISSPDPDQAIVGDSKKDNKGVLDIENDIRAVLQSSYTLGGVAENIEFEPTIIEEFELKNILMRSVRVPVRFLYRQTDGV